MVRAEIPSLVLIKRIESGIYRLNIKDLIKVEELVDKLLYKEGHGSKRRKGNHKLKNDKYSYLRRN